MSSRIVVLAGDGVGPEVSAQAVRVLETVATRTDLDLEFHHALLGGVAIDAVGSPLPDETLQACKSASAVFLGAVGGPQWDTVPVEIRPEVGLLGLRKELGLFANLRPVRTIPALAAASPLKNEKLDGVAPHPVVGL